MSTLAQQISAFFARMPDEELTTSDVAVKFNVNETTAKKALKRMYDAGQLQRGRLTGTTAMVYRVSAKDGQA